MCPRSHKRMVERAGSSLVVGRPSSAILNFLSACDTSHMILSLILQGSLLRQPRIHQIVELLPLTVVPDAPLGDGTFALGAWNIVVLWHYNRVTILVFHGEFLAFVESNSHTKKTMLINEWR